MRILTATYDAPASARSVAISAPLLPTPITSARLTAQARPLRYSDEWITCPAKVSRPGQGQAGHAVLAGCHHDDLAVPYALVGLHPPRMARCAVCAAQRRHSLYFAARNYIKPNLVA